MLYPFFRQVSKIKAANKIEDAIVKSCHVKNRSIFFTDGIDQHEYWVKMGSPISLKLVASYKGEVYFFVDLGYGFNVLIEKIDDKYMGHWTTDTTVIGEKYIATLDGYPNKCALAKIAKTFD